MPYKDPADQRAAFRKHYQANKSAYIARATKHNKENRRRIRAYIADYLQSHACVDCGESDPIVLEFDHRRPADKLFDIGSSAAKNKTLKRVIAEINKCDVRCANCHRRRTHLQRQQGEFDRDASNEVDQLVLFN